MNLEKLKTVTKIIEYQENSPDWIPISNVDYPWGVLLIPKDINVKPHFDSSIIYFNRKFINSNIIIVPIPVFEYGLNCFRVQERLIPILRTFDSRKNWKQLSEIEQKAVMKTINEWLVEQLQNAKKRNPDKKIVLFFYGIIERRNELNGYVKNGINYTSRHIIKIF